jgi:hypothetical protein
MPIYTRDRLVIAATLSNYFDRTAPREVAIPLLCAVAFSVVDLLMTVKAAPIMLALGKPQSDAALKNAFDQFYWWGLYLRGSVDTLAFLANVWALSCLSALKPQRRSTHHSSQRKGGIHDNHSPLAA